MPPLTLKSFSRIDVFGTVRLLPLSGVSKAVGLVQGFRCGFLGGATLGVVWYVGCFIGRILRRRWVLQNLQELRELRELLEVDLVEARNDRIMLEYWLSQEESEETLIRLRQTETVIERAEELIQRSRESERWWMETLERDN
jgi:hypothetical protein